MVWSLRISISAITFDTFGIIQEVFENRVLPERIFLEDSVFTTDELAIEFCRLVCANKIPEMWIANVPLSCGVVADMAGMIGATEVRYVMLDEVGITDREICHILAAFRACPSLVRVSLARNAIGQAGAAAIARVLADTSVTKLDLSGNQIGDGAAAELAHPRCHLQSLTLASCGIRQEGFEKMCANLRIRDSALGFLDMCWNAITNIDCISEVLSDDRCVLHTVSLADNAIANLDSLGRALGSNRCVRNIYLGGNRGIDDAAIERAFFGDTNIAVHPAIMWVNVHPTSVSNSMLYRISRFVRSINCRRTKIVIAICSAKVRRLGKGAAVSKLPAELVQLVASFLSYDDPNEGVAG